MQLLGIVSTVCQDSSIENMKREAGLLTRLRYATAAGVVICKKKHCRHFGYDDVHRDTYLETIRKTIEIIRSFQYEDKTTILT